MLKPLVEVRSLSIAKIALIAALAHAALSFAIFAWMFSRADAGLPDSRVALTLFAVLCFPVLILRQADAAIGVPDVLYVLGWLLSVLLWAALVAIVVYFYRQRRAARPPSI
jgi:hypothetical protein